MSNDKKNENKSPIREFLIPGAEYLARNPNFSMVGRKAELKMLAEVLIQEDGENSLIITGDGGVGVTSIIMGLEASKDDPETSFDIAGKNYYWLDTDSLFSSGDAQTVRQNFQKVLDTLSEYSNSVLVIQNAREFIDAAKRDGYSYFINALMLALDNNRFQAILECRTDELEQVYNCHPYLNQIFAVRQIDEPKPADLEAIVAAASERLEKAYGIPISPEARTAAIKLTQQYRIAQIDRAQPDRARKLLGLAMAGLREHAHTQPPVLDELQTRLETVNRALSGENLGGFGSKTPAELTILKEELEAEITQANFSWKELRLKIRKNQSERHDEERAISRIRDEIAMRDTPKSDAKMAFKTSADCPDVEAEAKRADLEAELLRRQHTLADKQALYGQMVGEINAGLVLSADHVMAKFSAISGLPVSRLGQDEISRLKNLDNSLSARVTGQPEAVQAVADAVRIGRLGLKKPDEPMGSFLFLGPSGAGKTELAKALAYEIFGDESALQRYDMSTYGGEDGAARFMADLLRNMRKRPYCVNVFDEIEKAPRELFDLFLPIMDEGRVTDSLGVVTSFGNSINIVTSNIGQNHFYDEKLTFEEASEKALADLRDPEKGGYRNESLNRFTGIYCFHPLNVSQVQMIAGKRLQAMSRWVRDKGLSIDMSEEDLQALCADRFEVRGGARSVLQAIKTDVASDVASVMLENPGTKGSIRVEYNREAKGVKAMIEEPDGSQLSPDAAKPTGP